MFLGGRDKAEIIFGERSNHVAQDNPPIQFWLKNVLDALVNGSRQFALHACGGCRADKALLPQLFKIIAFPIFVVGTTSCFRGLPLFLVIRPPWFFLFVIRGLVGRISGGRRHLWLILVVAL